MGHPVQAIYGPNQSRSVCQLPQPFGKEARHLLRLLISGQMAGIGQQVKLAASGSGVEVLHLRRGDSGIFATGNGQDRRMSEP